MKTRITIALILALAVFALAGAHAEYPAVEFGAEFQSSSVEVLDVVGFVFDMPEAAENIEYSIIEYGDTPIAQARFTLDGQLVTWRVCSAVNAFDLSGMLAELTVSAACTVGYSEGVVALAEDGRGAVVFFDITPGFMYSMSVAQGATEEGLVALANALYVPMQGDADGDPEMTDAV